METLGVYGGYRNKKQIKEALAAGRTINVYSVSIFGNGSVPDGRQNIVLPSPEDRRTFGTVEVKDGAILKLVN